MGLYAITNNYCIIRARNDFYLPATLSSYIACRLEGVCYNTVYTAENVCWTVLPDRAKLTLVLKKYFVE